MIELQQHVVLPAAACCRACCGVGHVGASRRLRFDDVCRVVIDDVDDTDEDDLADAFVPTHVIMAQEIYFSQAEKEVDHAIEIS